MTFLKLFLTLRWFKAIQSLYQPNDIIELQNLVEMEALNCFVTPRLGHTIKQYTRDLTYLYNSVNLTPAGVRVTRHPSGFTSLEDMLQSFFVEDNQHRVDMWVGGGVAKAALIALDKGERLYHYKSLTIRIYITWRDDRVKLNDVIRIGFQEKWNVMQTRLGFTPTECPNCEETLIVDNVDGTCNNCGADVDGAGGAPDDIVELFKQVREYEKESGKLLLNYLPKEEK